MILTGQFLITVTGTDVSAEYDLFQQRIFIMFVRVLVGVAAAAFAVGLLVCTGYGYIIAIGIMIAIFCPICMHEIMGVSQCQNKKLTAVTMIFSALLPLYIFLDLGRFVPFSDGVFIAAYIIAVLIMMLKSYEKTKFENAAIGLFCSIAIPESLCGILRTYNLMENSGLFCRSQVIFVLLIAMYASWLSDTFALFTGMALGKHKLSPKISPKKTVEGAVGGVVGTTVFALATYAICHHFFFHADVIEAIKWWHVLIATPILCVGGMCGDLSASVIKRNFGVKDFGTMFPAHGGAMDRIDSFLFTVPVTYILMELFVAASK